MAPLQMVENKIEEAPSGDQETIVICGISGKFPSAKNIKQYAERLYGKADTTVDVKERWPHCDYNELPSRMGILPSVNQFDAGYFGISMKEANYMDAMCRMLLECAYEAIVDAGMSPAEFRGKRTAMIIGSSTFESEHIFYKEDVPLKTYCAFEAVRSVLSFRLSYWLKSQSQCIVADTACSSSMHCFDHAYNALKHDGCDYVIVAGTNLCLNPSITLQFYRLGVLSKDGSCKSFDDSANGYVRSEGITVAIMQKAATARRVYAKVVHTKSNCDGYKSQGITYPSGESQKELLLDFYSECGVPPTSLTYVEAHGTGTHVGDPEELNTIDSVFCTGRDRLLPIGSVKSNIGHNEPASGLSAIFKVIIGYEYGKIPPNRNYNKPRRGVNGLLDGRMVVVKDPMPWPDYNGLVGINSFGFGGANSHTLIKWNEKVKENGGIPRDNLPRLVCVSGRSEESVTNILEDLLGRPLDEEYVSLYHHSFKQKHENNHHRGYAILWKNHQAEPFTTTINEQQEPLNLYFGARFNNVSNLLRSFYQLPLFRKSLERFSSSLKANNIHFDLQELLQNFDASNLLHAILGNVIVQFGVLELLDHLHVKYRHSIGVSLGVLTSHYAQKNLSLNQLTALTFFYGQTLLETCHDLGNAKHLKSLIQGFIKKVVNLEDDKASVVQDLISNLLCQNLNAPFEDGLISTLACGETIHKIPEERLMKVFEDNSNDVFTSFLHTLGRLYNLGHDLDLTILYPKVNLPVSRGTPMISSLIAWNHKPYKTLLMEKKQEVKKYKKIEVATNQDKWSFVTGHVIDGRNLFPATAYMYCVWELFAAIQDTLPHETSVVFKNVKFVRAANIPKDGEIVLHVTILRSTGEFEVTEDNVTMVTGTIKLMNDETQLEVPCGILEDLPLKEKDIYKELRLRGYNYQGLFRGLKACSIDASKALVEWKNNWIAFLDNLLQVTILKEDTRSLCVPTGILHLSIDVKTHFQRVLSLDDGVDVLPVFAYHEANTIRSGGAELRGLSANVISKRKPRGAPVLETYKFIANDATLNIDESIRITAQLILENLNVINVKIVEIIEQAEEPLSPMIVHALGDLPLIQPNATIYTTTEMEINNNVNVEPGSYKLDAETHLIIGTNFLKNRKLADYKSEAYILTRENSDTFTSFQDSDFQILTNHHIGDNDHLILLGKTTTTNLNNSKVINLTGPIDNFNWLSKLKDSIAHHSDVIVYSRNSPINGVLGLVNCLRKESNGSKVRCLLLDESAPDNYPTSSDFFKNQLSKRLAINVFKDGQWGTYRHFLLNDPIKSKKLAKHCYANVKVPGDLSSLTWIEGSLNQDVLTEIPPVQIYYSALNFRDVMTASGRIAADAKNRVDETCFLGFEYSGVDENGIRLMGMTKCAAIASEIVPDPHLSWMVPADWTLADAATVPVVYATCLYAMVVVGRMKGGNRILIHSGTGGVGQAAINIALHYGCKIFTTVGTEEKKQFVLAKFPQIPESHIGNSRDTSFEEMVMNQTDGRGVDLVLNSLAEEKLQASVRCLSYGGRFLEIGKFDLQSNNGLDLKVLTDAKSFNGVCLDKFFDADAATKKSIYNLLKDGLDTGMVKPLVRTIFSNEKVEEAFRHMGTGKHIGKVLISVRNEDKSEALPNCLPRFYCNPEHCSIILGGLGGFGLELADWLVIRGARKLVLTSRRGITSGYQRYRIQIWKNYGAEVVVRMDDVTTEEGCAALIRAANKWAPIENIFNLAVVLRDKTFENQTEEDFQTSLAPKAFATQHLDKITRTNCDNLRNFIVFSSVSCGRGNGGQTNYGMANSIMERICEQRRQDNLPGIAIQWGAVGDVGLVAEVMDTGNELVIGGTLQQKISNCLEVLDSLMNQTEPVVASMVVAEKKLGSGNESVIEAVANILGIRDLKTVSPHVKLPEIGMDSMMGVEIKQTLEREYDIFLTPQDIRNLTFARLQEIVAEREEGMHNNVKDDKAKEGQELLFRYVIDESESKELNIVLQTNAVSKHAPTVFFLPGYEGTSKIFTNLCAKLAVNAICFQYCFEEFEETVPDMARNILPRMVEKLGHSKNFVIIAHSFGTLVALEVASMLEEHGYVGKLILIDGAPQMVKQLIYRQFPEDLSDNDVHITLLFRVLTHMFTLDLLLQHKPDLEKYPTYEGKVDFLIENLPSVVNHSKRYQRLLAMSLYKRFFAMKAYKPSFSKIRSEIYLYKATIQPFGGLEEDFGLSEMCHQQIHLKTFEGDHVSVLDNEEIAAEINKQFIREMSDKTPIVDINRANEMLLQPLVEH